MNKFNRKVLHAALVDAGVEVYEAHGIVATAGTVVIETIAEARESLDAKAFAAWALSEFGSGGSTRAEDYVEGAWARDMRSGGMLAQRGATKDDERDSSADALNVFLSRSRIIAHKCASDAGYTLGESFRKSYTAASAKGSGSNSSKKRGKKEAEKPSEVVDLKSFTAFAESHLPAAIEILQRIMLKRKDTIRAATLGAIRDQLVANS